MRRYWKLTVLIPLIVVGIGTYYVEASAMNQPDYYLKTQEGSAQEAASVQLQAQYNSQQFSIGTHGSDYQSSQSFWASLDSNYYPSNALKNLAKEYPQFMRGKRNPNGFYVDDNVVGYANISSPNNMGQPDFRLDVSVYDKKQKGSSSFTVDVPKMNVAGSVYLYKVNISEQTMELFTLNQGGDAAPAVHVYTLDLGNKRLVSDQTLFSAGSSNNPAAISEASQFSDLKPPSNYAVFQVTRFNTDVSGEPSNLQRIQLYVYDIQSGKLSTIQNPTLDNLLKHVLGGLQINQQIGNDLYLITQTNPGAPQVVVQYDLTGKKIRSQFTIEPKDLGSNGGVVNFAGLINHRLYLMVSSPSRTTPPTLAIVSLDTGKVLYEGIVTRKDNKPVENLEFNNVSLN